MKRLLILTLLSLTFTAVAAAQNVIRDECPVIEIMEPSSGTAAGDLVTFTAKVSGSEQFKGGLTYNWAVTAGTIESGQGTPTIIVRSPVDGDVLIAATVEVTGNTVGSFCTNSASSTADVLPKPKASLHHEFERGNCEEVLAALDAFFVALSNDPFAHGVIVVYGNSKATATAIGEISRWVGFRKIDGTRLTIIRGGGGGSRARIQMWIVPPGAEMPKIDPAIEPEKTENEGKIPAGSFVFSSEYDDSIGGCQEELNVEGFAAVLKKYPKRRGRIVVIAQSAANFRNRERAIVRQLIKFGIARTRFSTVHKKTKALGGIELWLMK